jgi:hypothetical protein
MGFLVDSFRSWLTLKKLPELSGRINTVAKEIR